MRTTSPTSTPRRGRFDKNRADKPVEFFANRLSHVKGRWAGRPLILEPWQVADIIHPIFGRIVYDPELKAWVRLVRTAYVEIPRKNTKSTMGAGIGLYLTFADGEKGAEIYSVAEDLDQANVVFDIAKKMVEANPGLDKRAKVYKRLIEIPKTGSIYRVIPGDAAGSRGINPHGVIFDELLTQKNRELWDVMTSAQGARAQPLTVAFSTAGVFGTSEVCREQHEYGQKIVRGIVKDPSFHYVRYGLSEDKDDQSDWQDEKTWKACNPSLGTSITISFLRSEHAKAKASPARENSFRREYLNEWTQQLTRWLPLARWQAKGNIQLVVEEQLKGRTCYGGIDLASSVDIAALCWDFPSEDESHDAIWRFWLPQEKLRDLDSRTGGQASVWVREGFLQVTEGDVIDYTAILNQIDKDAQAFDIMELAYDPWGMTQLSQDLIDLGMNMVPFRQGFASMSPATKEWEKVIYEGKYRHGRNPVMTWMVDNIVVRQDPAGNIKIDKSKSSEKVDGPVASVMALGRAVLSEGGEAGFYVLGEA